MRLDQLVVQKGLCDSREKARRSIMAGLVRVDGRVGDKPGVRVAEDAEVTLDAPAEPFVSRAGRKLAHALSTFEVVPTDWTCADVGASTGGFTDCLLQNGARHVYAIDVGYGQLDYSLRQDARVTVMERVNARNLEPGDLPEPCDLATMDLSFISLTKVVPAVVPLLKDNGWLITLIKPQFEVGKGRVGKGGIVRDETLRREVIEQRIEDLSGCGLSFHGVTDSPVEGARGNREALALFSKSDDPRNA